MPTENASSSRSIATTRSRKRSSGPPCSRCRELDRTWGQFDEITPSTSGPGNGPPIYFVKVPEAKGVKNRVHLDLQPRRFDGG